ncbi:helix-turn-helix domain-containing protein [Streptosporangium sp. NBC_01495]|uniref:helix-turn-helix domain-containing protein n=1 Tax=Streptosporangium sp. NBC_01495 TaxID=2903899 RepID=UPI002E2EA879|nr:MerR family transcriptional regulator [Streptosporangium sp. NBC_01495]
MEWTIGELAERASAALTPTAQLNGRVRDVPNERLIRWYSTIGLLDPPSARRGRVAMYGRRHLLQIVAVKRRQSDGRTIAEIQAELAGATDQTLESIARLPGPPPEHTTEPSPGHPPAPPAETGSPRAARPRFWAGPAAASAATGPAPPKPPPPASPGKAPSPPASSGKAPPPPAETGKAPPAQKSPDKTPPAPGAVIVHGVRLANGVTLMLDTGGHAPTPDDLAEIAAASEGLLSLLRERGLTPPEGIHA